MTPKLKAEFEEKFLNEYGDYGKTIAASKIAQLLNWIDLNFISKDEVSREIENHKVKDTMENEIKDLAIFYNSVDTNNPTKVSEFINSRLEALKQSLLK